MTFFWQLSTQLHFAVLKLHHLEKKKMQEIETFQIRKNILQLFSWIISQESVIISKSTIIELEV